MNISPDGLDLIKHFEGFSPKGYICPAGKLTIGYGHVIRDDEREKFKDRDVSETEATSILMGDVADAVRSVERLVTVPLAQCQFDALVSFVYNVGQSAFAISTMLRMILDGDKEGAAAQFSRWVHGGGRVLPGLVRRRQAESSMFENKPWR